MACIMLASSTILVGLNGIIATKKVLQNKIKLWYNQFFSKKLTSNNKISKGNYMSFLTSIEALAKESLAFESKVVARISGAQSDAVAQEHAKNLIASVNGIQKAIASGNITQLFLGIEQCYQAYETIKSNPDLENSLIDALALAFQAPASK
jgi:hypothetical protein